MIIELYVYHSAQFQYSAFEAKKKNVFNFVEIKFSYFSSIVVLVLYLRILCKIQYYERLHIF